MSRRFLLYFSYLGTNYKGLQRQTPYSKIDVETVQGVIECALSSTLRIPTSVIISSRTDTGVHALESTAQFDLDGNNRDRIYCPERVCAYVNNFLEDKLTDIRLKRIVEVDPLFHARFSAATRTYCYRIAVSKPDILFSNIRSVKRATAALPISKLYRYHYVAQPFDFEAVYKACPIFLGTQNFRSFMVTGTDTKYLEIDDPKFQKTICRISVSKFNDPQVPNQFDPVADNFDFYDFHLEGTGFLRRQVKRMVGALVGVGQGLVSVDKIVHLLKNPHKSLWLKRCPALPSSGLYLKSVNYENVPILRGLYSEV